ncbi:hypothetical protein C8R41DRAFT_919459 [Lentinula lateritia]|uniref:Uncharacterized protein n=1 Tax=Lentinula lateritia TaxID=40482 RepID=A0ABQ8VM35_9AGAR|nr:hypothetical protein C8R41DRAFT_919459 [Lentinula lateritia]
MIRHKLTKLYRPLNYLTDLLNRIGPDGMSEDEEDGSKDQPQFIVLTPQWRALELTMLLRKLDKLHMLMWTKGRTRPSKGSAVKVMTENKVAKLGIEPRTFWLYPRCSNQLSYPALVQLMRTLHMVTVAIQSTLLKDLLSTFALVDGILHNTIYTSLGGSSASSTDGDSPMGSSTSSTDSGLGATGSAAASSMGTGSLPSGTSSALGSTSGSAASASPSGAATTTSAGYSSAHKQLKGKHREEWRKFKEANPSVKADLKSAKGNVQAFLQTPSGKALAKENEAFQKFVETHVVEHHKKHGQNHHHQSASSQQPTPSDGSSSASSSPSAPASANGANSAPVGRSVLAARMGFGAHGSSLSTLPANRLHGLNRHRHGRSMPAEAASGTPGQTSAFPIQSSSSTANGPGMGAVNGAPSSFSGTPSSGALSGPSTSGLPPSAPPNGNGQGPHPEGPGPHGHRFEEGPMGHEHHFGGPMEPERHFGGPHHHNNFGGLPPANGNTGSVPGTPPNAATGASSLPPPPPSGATSQGMPGAPARRALQRVRRSTPYGNFGADLD